MDMYNNVFFYYRIVRLASPSLNYMMIIGATALTLAAYASSLEYSIALYITVTTFCTVSEPHVSC